MVRVLALALASDHSYTAAFPRGADERRKAIGQTGETWPSVAQVIDRCYS